MPATASRSIRSSSSSNDRRSLTVPQFTPLQLAGSGLGQLFDKLDFARIFERRDHLLRVGLQVGDKLLRRFRIRRRHDERLYLLPALRTGDSDDGAFGDRRM